MAICTWIFPDDKTKEYDKQVLIVRTFWVLLHIATCLMIILGKVLWDGGKMKVGITFSQHLIYYMQDILLCCVKQKVNAII